MGRRWLREGEVTSGRYNLNRWSGWGRSTADRGKSTGAVNSDIKAQELRHTAASWDFKPLVDTFGGTTRE